MAPHTCNLQYSQDARNTFTLGAGACSICQRNHSILRTARSRMLNSFHRKSSSEAQVKPTSAIESEAVLATVDDSAVTRRKKLEKVLSELKISEMKIHEKFKHALVALVDRCLDAFAADDDDI